MTADASLTAAPAADAAASEQDFAAALYEIDSNTGVRRLMFVLSNVLIPALGVALIDALTGAHYTDALRWLPEAIIPLVGAVLALTGILVSGILTRCHFGMVVNGNKMVQVRDGALTLRGLNWLGVTTNFVLLTAIYAGAGLGLLLLGLGLPWPPALAAALALVALLLFALWWTHGRANRLSQRLIVHWQHGPVSAPLRERHARLSLEAAASDVSVIVVMAVALFSGLFNCMTGLGALNPTLDITPSGAQLQAYGAPLLGGFTLLALLLSGRMVVRLRIALAQNAERLARLRNEQDRPWRFAPLERTFLLYTLLHLLTSASAALLLWPLFGRAPALSGAVALLAAGLVWYPLRLAAGERRLRHG